MYLILHSNRRLLPCNVCLSQFDVLQHVLTKTVGVNRGITSHKVECNPCQQLLESSNPLPFFTTRVWLESELFRQKAPARKSRCTTNSVISTHYPILCRKTITTQRLPSPYRNGSHRIATDRNGSQKSPCGIEWFYVVFAFVRFCSFLFVFGTCTYFRRMMGSFFGMTLVQIVEMTVRFHHWW